MEIEKAIDLAGQEMIELSQNGSVIARIYPHPEGIRIVSEYLDGVQHEGQVYPKGYPGIPPAGSIVVRLSAACGEDSS